MSEQLLLIELRYKPANCALFSISSRFPWQLTEIALVSLHAGQSMVSAGANQHEAGSLF